MNIRIAYTYNTDVDFCEPDDKPKSLIGFQVSRCTCSRVAFRIVGDHPLVRCICGKEFNSNEKWIGVVL